MSYSNTSEKLSILTSKGDLLVNNGSSVVRLSSGSNGQTVYADSSASNGLSWGAAPAASGNIFEIATTTLTAAAASIEFSSLTASGSTKDLGFIFTGWNTTSETAFAALLYIQFNSATYGYDWRATRSYISNPQNNLENRESEDAQIRSSWVIGKSSANIGPSCCDGTIRGGMTFWRGGSSSISSTNDGNQTTAGWGAGGNGGSNTINSLKFFLSSGAFASGSSITIYRTTQA